MKDRTERGLRMRDAHTGTKASHHFDPIIVLLEIVLGEVAGPRLKQEIRVERNIEVGSERRIYAEESQRRDAGHEKGNVVDQDRLPGRSRSVAEKPLARGEAEDGY